MRKCHEAKASSQKKLVFENVSKGKSHLVFKEFNQDVSRRELANFVVLHEQPLSIVDHVGFKRFVSSLQPHFNMITRNTLKSDIHKIFEHEQLKMKKILASDDTCRVGITSDMWTSQNQQKGYMVITAHWIDSSWKLQSRVIRFAYVPCPHTAEKLSKVLMSTFLDWNLDRRLSTITLDNCSTNDAIVKFLLDKLDRRHLLLGGDHVQMRCTAHIINLIVTDGMEVIASEIGKIRDSVAFWRATPKREEKFEESCRNLGITYSKKLVLDCKTRWNSTCLMLRTALLYRDVFPRLKQRESSYKSLPSFDEWELAKNICDRLELFLSLTELFSGSKYPTANLYFSKVMEIKWTLTNWLDDPNESIRDIAKKMVEKFDKYWLVMHGMMGVAAMLDPRYKNKVLELYKDEEAEKLKKICRDMYLEYEKKYKSEKGNNGKGDIPGPSQSSRYVSSTDASVGKIVRFDDMFSQYLQPESLADSLKSDLDLYFDERIQPMAGQFDILEWWKANGSRYPIVARMARDILAIPLTSVASESAFSTSGRLLDPFRSRLSPKIVESLLCSKSWLWSTLVDEGQAISSFYNALTNDKDENDTDDE